MRDIVTLGGVDDGRKDSRPTILIFLARLDSSIKGKGQRTPVSAGGKARIWRVTTRNRGSGRGGFGPIVQPFLAIIALNHCCFP